MSSVARHALDDAENPDFRPDGDTSIDMEDRSVHGSENDKNKEKEPPTVKSNLLGKKPNRITCCKVGQAGLLAVSIPFLGGRTLLIDYKAVRMLKRFGCDRTTPRRLTCYLTLSTLLLVALPPLCGWGGATLGLKLATELSSAVAAKVLLPWISASVCAAAGSEITRAGMKSEKIKSCFRP